LLPFVWAAAGIYLLGIRRRNVKRLLMLAVFAIGAGLLGSCGGSGGGSGGGTNLPVNATVTVTATAGTLQQTVSFTLTID
jgi:multidrug efflux pump subunit AcrA (membrane-fusion protein)